MAIVRIGSAYFPNLVRISNLRAGAINPRYDRHDGVSGMWYYRIVGMLSDISEQSQLARSAWESQGAMWRHIGLNVQRSTPLDRWSGLGAQQLLVANSSTLRSMRKR